MVRGWGLWHGLCDHVVVVSLLSRELAGQLCGTGPWWGLWHGLCDNVVVVFFYYPGDWQDNCAALVLGWGLWHGICDKVVVVSLLSRGLAGQLCGTGPWWGLWHGLCDNVVVVFFIIQGTGRTTVRHWSLVGAMTRALCSPLDRTAPTWSAALCCKGEHTLAYVQAPTSLVTTLSLRKAATWKCVVTGHSNFIQVQAILINFIVLTS